jgi:CRISPR-associated endonuclease Cas1/group II intron reverse transcriptase/maturase
MRHRKPFLFDRLTNSHELERAWLDVLAHYPKERIPPELRAFDRKREGEIKRLSAALRTGSFGPEPASLIFIRKINHPEEQRPIALIRPEDRIVLTALNRIVSPLFERQLLPFSFAYRPGKGAWAAIERVIKCLRQGLTHTASADIDDFFSNIDRDRLLRDIRRTIFEKPILDLLEIYLHIGSAREFEWTDSGRGVAQGSPLSPLLSNIALAGFDRFLNEQGAEWVRYADNFILLGIDPAQVRDTFERAEAFLLDNCGLRLNPGSRSFACEKDGFDFLGFWFRDGRRTITPKKLDQKRSRIQEILQIHQIDLPGAVRDLTETIEGWRAYYGKSPDTRDQLLMLEQHLAALLQPWLARFRSQRAGKELAAAELKSVLAKMTLPVTNDPARKLKWVELIVARSRPRKESGPAHGLSAAARHAIEQRKKEYRKLKEEREEVLVTRPGTYLGRTGERLLIRNEGKREAEIPLSMIRNITLLTKAVSLSGDLMAEAANRGINIVLAGSDGRPLVRIGAAELTEHQLSLLQSTMAASTAGLELARIVVAGKIRNQANLLRYYLKYPERRADGDFLSIANAAIKEMEAVRETVITRDFGGDLDLERNRLFASEGQAAATYWAAVRSLLWWKPGFEGRVRRGANDLVNSLLNYGYGILYSRLMNVLVRAGLNVYVGFLHKPQKGKAGLLYDFIEEFRASAVDRTVFSLLNLAVDAKISADGLDSDTRREFARKIVERLQAATRYHGESMPLEKVMEQQAQLLVRHIQGSDRYKTWVLPW